MSRFSGKCDLFDHICMEKMYDRGNYKISDEIECFEIFKKKTDGVIYQSLKINLTDQNIDSEIKTVNDPKILSKIEHKYQKIDKRTKAGIRNMVYYTYIYMGQSYKTLKEINKLGYYIQKKIHFNTILDLIPYYPYLISVASCNKDKEFILITKESFVDQEEKLFLSYGHASPLHEGYRKELQNHYRDIVLKYFNSESREIKETLTVFEKDSELFVKTTYPIDYNFDIDVERTLHDWIYTHPKCLKNEDFDAGLVYVDDIWPHELKSGDALTISYVKKVKHELDLEV